MKKLTCEMCGSTDMLKQDGVFVCQSCGMKYSVEEAKKMMIEGTVEVKGTVKVDNTSSVANYLKMAESAYESQNHTEAELYANKVIEIDPINYQAWLIKGQAVGWQSTHANLRFAESVTAFTNALKNAPKEEKDDIIDVIGYEINELSCALISLRAERFVKWPDEEETAGFQQDLTVILKTINSLRSKKVSVPVDETLTTLAATINNSVIDAFQETIYPEYTNEEYPYPNSNDFTRYVNRIDNCIAVLGTAVALYTKGQDATIQIYENMRDLQNKAIEACSYDWEYAQNLDNPYNADTYRKKGFIVDARKGRVYFADKRLTDKAKAARRKLIDKYQDAVDDILYQIELQKNELTELFWKNNDTEYKFLVNEIEKAEKEIALLKNDKKGHIKIQRLEKYISDVQLILEIEREPNERLNKEDKDFINKKCDTFWANLSSLSEYDTYLDQYPILKRADELASKRLDLINQREQIAERKEQRVKGWLTAFLGVASGALALVGIILAVVDESLLFLGVVMSTVGIIAAMVNISGTSERSKYMSAQFGEETKSMEKKYQEELSAYNNTIDEMNAVPTFTGMVNSDVVIKIPPKLNPDQDDPDDEDGQYGQYDQDNQDDEDNQDNQDNQADQDNQDNL